MNNFKTTIAGVGAMAAKVSLALAFSLIILEVQAQELLGEPRVITLPPALGKSAASPPAGTSYPIEDVVTSDRIHVRASRGQRGETVPIPQADLIRLCADRDGCTMRLGMYNWDNSGRVASRETLFYYNNVSHTWRASSGDTAGTDYNGATEHVLNAWSCYVTDGAYKDWKELGDSGLGFGLLSWNQYDAECWLTIID